MGTGIDIEQIDRIRKAHLRFGDRFLKRLFSERELNICMKRVDPYPCLTGRFCAKEALMKASKASLSFKDIEILAGEDGEPVAYIRSRKSSFEISISHSRDYAVAVAIAR